MFLRSILYPSIVALVIGAPMLYSTDWGPARNNGNAGAVQYNHQPSTANGSFRNGSFVQTGTTYPTPIRSQSAQLGGINVIAPTGATTINPAASASLQVPQFANSNPTVTSAAAPVAYPNSMQLPVAATLPPGMVVSGPVVAGSTVMDPSMFGMTPDYGATETFIFPGDANGPDLTAQPTDFVPVTNLAEIIRFDVYPNWVKSRWKRISTNPGESGLHGLRVALVTGTNTWDLHGSLTYYFDVNQRAQRITFRGWTGDSSRLVNLLTSQFDLKAQPTHWAGAYAAQNSRRVPTAGLLMQHPTVITRENPVQQVALVMELNHPQGSFKLSEEFLSMLRYAVSSQ